jgi:hypothetical protein
MSGLLFLKYSDFHIARGMEGKVLCHRIPSFSLILFYSTVCEHCHEFLQIFKKIPGSVNNCQFGIINVSSRDGKPIVDMAKETVSPLKFVPLILLYYNGIPMIRYNGPKNMDIIQKFIVYTAKNIMDNNKKLLMNGNQNMRMNSKLKIPEYCVGNPLYGDDENVCYLKEKDLENKAKQANAQRKR